MSDDLKTVIADVLLKVLNSYRIAEVSTDSLADRQAEVLLSAIKLMPGKWNRNLAEAPTKNLSPADWLILFEGEPMRLTDCWLQDGEWFGRSQGTTIKLSDWEIIAWMPIPDLPHLEQAQ